MLAAGLTESTVLVRAAEETGDSFNDRVFKDDSFAVTRLLDQTTSAGVEQVGMLAAEMGFTGTDWTHGELAQALARSGRVGEAITLGLKFAGDEGAARELVVNELVVTPQMAQAY